MITSLTGTPGSGKTAWIVQELTRLPSQRKLYVHGIPELKIAHEPIYCTSKLCEFCGAVAPEILNDPHAYYVEDWPQWATDGSLIVVDEVQYVWRPSNSASKIPYGIAALETHRHRGLDFWLISQGPHLFHSNIRLLIGRHIHLVSNWRGRTEYEFPECRQNVASRSDAIKRPYVLPKKIFGLYKSASLHTKLDKRKPMSLYVFVACIFFLVIGAFMMINRISGKFESNPSVPQTAGATSQATLGAGGGAAAVSAHSLPNPPPAQPVRRSSFPDFQPTIPGVLESAPAYAPLLRVVAAPLLSGCVYNITKDKCSCFTQQATPYPASRDYCMESVKNHRFNPYLARRRMPLLAHSEGPEHDSDDSVHSEPVRVASSQVDD
ncbi:MAG: zonular occludens toxin domain-containing protein [Methylobacter sp.]